MVRKFLILAGLLIALLISFIPIQSNAIELSYLDGVVFVTGEFYEGDSDKFIDFVNTISATEKPVFAIDLKNSNGGLFIEAADIGIFIYKNGFKTGVSGYCHSACAFVLLAGNNSNSNIIFFNEPTVSIHPLYCNIECRISSPNMSREEIIIQSHTSYGYYMGVIGVPFNLTLNILNFVEENILYLTPDLLSSYGYSIKSVNIE